MKNTAFTPPAPVQVKSTSNPSFGSYGFVDRPASAARTGINAMPDAWQTRGVPREQTRYQYGAPVRTYGEILSDTCGWVCATMARKIILAALTGQALLMLIY